MDESGAFGWELDNPSCGSHFVIVAIIVEEEHLEELRSRLQEVKEEFFPTTEMKSSIIGDDHITRRRILSKLFHAPFQIIPCIVDKIKMKDWEGMSYKETFYKHLNGHVYDLLKISFPNLIVCADEIISTDYMGSFIKYIKSKENYNLFGPIEFRFENSKENIFIQLADICSGSIRRTYDKTIQEKYDYYRMLSKKIVDASFYPASWHDYVNPNPAERKEFDSEISRICFDQAVLFLNKHKAISDLEERARVLTLRFLLTQMINKNNNYIQTRDIKRHLELFGLNLWATQAFRNKIIAKMRDQNVLITSSPHGYKIPTTEEELYSFIDHGNSIAVPLLARLVKCRNIIRTKTNNRVDLFNRQAYQNLQRYVESQNE